MESTYQKMSNISPGIFIFALIFIIAAVVIQIWVFKYVWNAVLPDLFKIPKITTYQAVMILILLMFIRPSIVPIDVLQKCK